MADGDNKRVLAHPKYGIAEQPDAAAFVIWSRGLAQGNAYGFVFLCTTRNQGTSGGGVTHQALIAIDAFGYIDNDGGGGAHFWSATPTVVWETAAGTVYTINFTGDTLELVADAGGGGDMVSVVLLGGTGVEFSVTDGPE